MANMSYCRFRNTALDLNDCLVALQEDSELVNLSEFRNQNQDEWRALKRLVALAKDIAEYEDEIEFVE